MSQFHSCAFRSTLSLQMKTYLLFVKQLYIIFKKPLKEASKLQLFVLATSFITAALGPTEWFLWSKQSQKTNRGIEKLSYESLGFKEKLPMLGMEVEVYIWS